MKPPHPAVFIVILFLLGEGAGNSCRELCFFCNFRFRRLWKQLHMLWAIRISYADSSEECGVVPVDQLSVSWHRQSGFGKHLALLWSAHCAQGGPEGHCVTQKRTTSKLLAVGWLCWLFPMGYSDGVSTGSEPEEESQDVQPAYAP